MTRSRNALVSCMKNEGLIALEWVAYHRAIGFDPIVVVTNNCADGTDETMDRLAAMGEVVHVRNPMRAGQSPQRSGLDAAMAHPAMRDVAWLLHLDADEFLHVSAGAGRVDDLLSVMPRPCDAIAVAWKPFGNSGLEDWPGGSTLTQLTLTDRKLRRGIAVHKTMFRPDRFEYPSIHMPKNPVSGDVVLRNTAGAEMDPFSLKKAHKQLYKNAGPFVTWENADIHHYAIRARDVFLMKNVRGDGMAFGAGKYYVNSTFWRRHNRNLVEDTAILKHLPAVNARLDAWRADPAIPALEARALAWFRDLRDRMLTPERRAAWTLPAEEDRP